MLARRCLLPAPCFTDISSLSSGRLGAWALSSWYRSRVRLSVSITCQYRCSTPASAAKSSVCSIDPRLSVALLLHQDLSIDKPGVVLFPPKWGGRSEGLEGTPRSLQTRGTVLIGIYEQYFSLCKVNLGLGKFYCCWYGNGFNDGFELKHTACPTFP